MLQTVSQNNAAHWWTNSEPSSPRATTKSRFCVRPAKTLLLGLLALFLLMCAGCAVKPPAVPPISSCHVPRSQLEPTPVPPMDDATNERLEKENHALRKALERANKDKALTIEYLDERCPEKQ